MHVDVLAPALSYTHPGRNFSVNSTAFSYLCSFKYVAARLGRLVKVLGSSGPSTLICKCWIFRLSSPAFSYLPWSEYVTARFAILVKGLTGLQDVNWLIRPCIEPHHVQTHFLSLTIDTCSGSQHNAKYCLACGGYGEVGMKN